MKTPSIKTLSAVFSDAKHAKQIFQMSHVELAKHPAGASRINECFHHPAWSDVRMHILTSIDPGLFGIESIQLSNGMYADYLNTGDTYATTVIYFNGSYRVQCIGDFIERNPCK